MFWVPVGIVLGCSVIGWIIGGAPTAWNVPHQGDGMSKAAALTPEFIAVLAGPRVLTLCVRCEVVRAGIQSVSPRTDRGGEQPGLSRRHSMRLVVLRRRCA